MPTLSRSCCFGLAPIVFALSSWPATAQPLGDYFYRPVPNNPSVAIIPVKFSDQEVPGFTLAAIEASRDTLETHLRENGFGPNSQVTITNVVPLPNSTTFYDDSHHWDSGGRIYRDLLIAAPGAGVTPSNFDYQIIFMSKVVNTGPNGFCQEGFTAAFVTNSLYQQPNAQNSNDHGDLAFHELGHNFGLEHANFWDVDPGETNPLTTAANEVNRGDRFDPMGSRFQIEPPIPDPWHLNPRLKAAVAVLGETDIYAARTAGTHNITLQAIEDPPGFIFGTKSAVSIRRSPTEVYHIFLRANQMAETGGVMVTRTRGGAGTLLYDMTPNSFPSKDWVDAGLAPGMQFDDPSVPFTLTNLGFAGRTASVVVELGTTLPGDRAPTANLTSPVVGSILTSNMVTYTATAFDPDVGRKNGDGIAFVEMKLRRPDAPPNVFVDEEQLFAPPYEWEVDLDLLGGDVTYELLVFATSDIAAPEPPVRFFKYTHWYLPPTP